MFTKSVFGVSSIVNSGSSEEDSDEVGLPLSEGRSALCTGDPVHWVPDSLPGAAPSLSELFLIFGVGLGIFTGVSLSLVVHETGLATEEVTDVASAAPVPPVLTALESSPPARIP